MISLRRSFPADMGQFRRQVQRAAAEAQVYLAGLERAIEALDAQQPARDREDAPRWQANYDLVRAQVAAYAARVYLYRTALAGGLKNLIVTPPKLAPDKQLVGWRIRQAKKAPVDKVAAEMLDEAKDLYLAVIENHPGTPWAARAEWELRRDFNYPGPTPRKAGGGGGGGGGGAGPGSGSSNWGIDSYQGIELVPEYGAPMAPGRPGAKPRPKHPPSGPQGPMIPIPKL
jgi:hypothetical protein